MFKRISALLIMLTVFFTCLPQIGLAMVEEGKIYIYVSPTGTENGDGTIENPFATVIQARDKIRALKESGAKPEKGFVVYLRGGDYQLKEGITFNEADSGTESAPIVYRSYPGEKPILVGGASLPADKFKNISDDTIKERIVDEDARDKVLQINLKELGFNDYGEHFLRGTYSYRNPVPSIRPEFNPPELVVDDNLLSLSRYPNEGYMTIQTVKRVGYADDLKNQEEYVEPFIISPGDNRISKWTKAKKAIIHGFWRYDWADQSMFIEKIDVKANTIEPHQGSVYGVLQGQKFYAYNLLEEIDIPGEYFLDHDTGVLYMYPPEGFTSDSSVTLSLLESDAIVFNGASYIDFKGIDISSMRAGAIIIEKGDHIRFMDAEIKFAADFAVEINKYAFNCGLVNCYVHDVDGGVRLNSGIVQTLTPGNSYVENCEFERYSRLTKTYRGAVNSSGVENRIAYNEIHDGPHLALQIGGFDTIIEYNEIYNVLKEADDMATIYTGLTYLMRGQQVRYNYIHDIVSESGQGAGAHAIYLDGSQSGVSVYGNIIENIESGAALFINGGHDNNFVNNIVINTSSGVQMGQNSEFTKHPDVAIKFLEDSVYKSAHWDDASAEPWNQPIFTERYPEMLASFENHPELPMNNKMINNLFVNTKKTDLRDNTNALLLDENNVATNKDPGFYDMPRRNYILKEDASIFKENPKFISLPFSRMGRYDNRALYRVKDAVVLALNTPLALRNGENGQVDPENLKVVPKLIGDKTYVPLRFIAESIGAEVSYDEQTRGIKIKGENTTLEMAVDSTSAAKNGESFTMEEAPIISENRTLVPLREVVNLFDKKVFWDDCGLIAISDAEDLFNHENDREIISYLYNNLTIY